MDDRKGDVAEKGLPAEPEQGCGILPNRPKHGDILKLVISLPDDIDTFIFQSCQMIHKWLSY
jgi:hypothetical protein